MVDFKKAMTACNRKPICDFLLVINSIVPSILPSFQVAADIKFSLATGGHYILTHSLGWCPANIAIIDTPRNTRFFRLHFTCRMYRCIFNHFYVIGAKSYRIRLNNANYTAIRRSESSKVTDYGTNRKPKCDFLLVINTNLPHILHVSKLWPIIGQIFAIDIGVPHFYATARGDSLPIAG